MTTIQGTRRTEYQEATKQAEGGIADALLDATVIALIAAGFVSLAFNTFARL